MSIDVEALLAPVAGDLSCGEDLSFSSLFDDIAAARREDDPALDQGEWVTTLKVADWPLVVRKAEAALRTQTKDLRLTGWLTEALAKTASFTGLAQGLDLIEQLCGRYWQELHPLIDGDDLDARIGSLDWILNRVSALVRQLPLTADTTLEISYADYQAAQALRGAMERDPDGAERIAEGRVTMADINLAVEKSGSGFFQGVLDALRASQAAAGRLSQQLDTQLGLDGPNAAPMLKAFDEVLELAEQLAHQGGWAGALQDGAQPSAMAQAKTTAEVADRTADAAGPLRTRAQAIAQLRQVADFFRRTEPHSPVAYLADRAARWGDMPLHDWLRAVVKDEGALSQIEELLGIESRPRDE
jgi:type VI secretion system protein ImpA